LPTAAATTATSSSWTCATVPELSGGHQPQTGPRHAAASDLRGEYVVRVSAKSLPAAGHRGAHSHGRIEVAASELKSWYGKTPPFYIEEVPVEDTPVRTAT
jgi:hypothetical protein